MSSTLPIVVGITGASGAPYAVRLLQALTAAHRPVSLIVSKYGLRLIAIREDEQAAEAMGIDTTAHKVSAFMISAFFPGAHIEGNALADADPGRYPEGNRFPSSAEFRAQSTLGTRLRGLAI